MFRKQTKRNVRNAAAREIEERLLEQLPKLAALQDGYEGAELGAISVSANKNGDGYMAVARIALPGPVATYWLENGYDEGHYVVWGHGDTPLQALCAIEAELAGGAAAMVPDKYPPEPRSGRSKAPARAKTHAGSKPYG